MVKLISVDNHVEPLAVLTCGEG